MPQNINFDFSMFMLIFMMGQTGESNAFNLISISHEEKQ